VKGCIEEERIAEAFDRLDSDDSGFISPENLCGILGEGYSETDIQALIADADADKDGQSKCKVAARCEERSLIVSLTLYKFHLRSSRLSSTSGPIGLLRRQA